VARALRTPAGIQILIAEDDPLVRDLVQQVVADLGHTPATARNGAEAWRLYREHGADVVISDWMMPRMSGPELCRRVRSQTEAPYAYFIMLTALGDAKHRRAGMEAGADDYLLKPFDTDEIEARLIAAERVTRSHRRREALLRQARRIAAEDDPRRLLQDLLDEAVRLVGGTSGFVTRWDETRGILVPVAPVDPNLSQVALLPGEGATGQAAQQRRAVLINDANCTADEREALGGAADACAAAAVPLVHEGRLIGTLTVSTGQAGRGFSREDAETLELLTATTSAALVALERARLEGVLLAARTAQHELNNQLALAKGYAELLVGSPELPPQLCELAEEVMRAADDAAEIVRKMRSVSRIQEVRWPTPSDTTLDLANSSAREPRRRHGTRRAFRGRKKTEVASESDQRQRTAPG
jgi:CheY-like chemotaxis protein